MTASRGPSAIAERALSSAYVTNAMRVTRIVIASCLALYPEKALLGELYMDEDAPVADDGDDERQRHAEDDSVMPRTTNRTV